MKAPCLLKVKIFVFLRLILSPHVSQYSANLWISFCKPSLVNDKIARSSAKSNELIKVRSSRPKVFYKIGALENFAKFTEKHLYSSEFCEIFRNTSSSYFCKVLLNDGMSILLLSQEVELRYAGRSFIYIN